jgi:4-hydroxy-tetrahydrodipicolinate synthase
MMHLEDDFLRGSFTPLVTPFSDGEVDLDCYERLVDRHIEAGGHGIVVNGTSAEPSTLTVEERNALLARALDVAKGRTSVVAATGSQSLRETQALTEFASDAGADAVLVVTPYYIRPPQRGLVAYYAEVAKATHLPFMIYHIPGRAAVSMNLDSFKAVADATPQFVGMKQAVNDLGFVTECLHHFGMNFRVFVGLEELSFHMLCIGACGMMNAVGNVAPREVAELYEVCARMDFAAGRKLHYALFELNRAVFYDTNPIPIKYMMKRMGLLQDNEHRLPMHPATAEVAARLDTVLETAGLI